MPLFGANELRMIASKIFEAAGSPKEEAQIVARLLVKANLTGVDSHGVIRIPTYVGQIREGKIKPKGEIEVLRETPSTALINGNWGFGQVVASKAMKIAIKKGKKHGVRAVGIFNCNHIGRLSDYSSMAIEHNMIGIVTSNYYARVAPFGGIDRIFNPGPISVAIPAREEKPVILDISTSVCSEGKIMVKRNRGEKVPDGWIIDKNGIPTNDPNDFFEGGAILPLGGNVGYKGYGLGIVVDLLAGALTGSGSASSSEYSGGNGVFIMTVDIAHFENLLTFKERVDTLIRTIKASRNAPSFERIRIPGERSLEEEARRSKKGILVEKKTWQEIRKTAQELGVPI